MKTKPKAAKYRNLFARGGVIYFERDAGGRREKFSTRTSDWDQAAATRDLYLQRKAQRAAGQGPTATFGELAKRYLAEATAHLSGSTLEDRTRLLEAEGALTAYFGPMLATEIRRAALLEWWHREVEGKGRHERTGLTYLSALSGVFGYAVDLELLEANPVDALRGTLRRRRRSKRGRAAGERAGHIRPLETPAQLAAFIAASRKEYDQRFRNGKARRQSQAGHVADLLQLDAGLRLGEVAGLRWRDVVCGGEGDDTTRALVIREAIARGRHEGPPKSGRERVVALSRRLRALLREFSIARGRPDAEARVLPGFCAGNYQLRHFAPVCTAAGLPRHTPKDLRDTFASQLLTAGVQLGYISLQLGHADVGTTARHYARWTGDGAYRKPFAVEPGEVPADLLARIGAAGAAEGSHHDSHHPAAEG